MTTMGLKWALRIASAYTSGLVDLQTGEKPIPGVGKVFMAVAGRVVEYMSVYSSKLATDSFRGVRHAG